MKIGIVGGSGLIGSFLAHSIIDKGDSVVIFSRKSSLPLSLRNKDRISLISAQIPLEDDLEALDVLINLAGEPIVGAKWTPERKEELRASRVDLTRAIFENLKKCQKLPSTYIAGSAIGFYGAYDEDQPECTETSPPGDDFLSALCVEWENASLEFKNLGLRTLVLRTGVVLTTKGGALAQMLPAFRTFVGGVVNPGTQILSWIHMEDLVSAILHLLYDDSLSGIFNLTSPNPVSNEIFSNELASVLHRPCIFRIPNFALEFIYGEGAVLVYKGQKVLPKRLEETNFRFKFPEIRPALEDLLKVSL
ncbi:MAG: TIGR01777 family protein [Leptospiraceae bacterium]|nr:TIGR01777 family oxidoreductase [Leptospiraceae bacterium]MCP5512842.1 TIGR01777 family protein [Leptospiraceae bacterium]